MTKVVEKDLLGAASTIDLIAMLRAKTQGNLSTEEEALIDQVLTELTQAYRTGNRAMKLAIIGNLDKPGLPDAVGVLLASLDRTPDAFVIDEGVAALLEPPERMCRRSPEDACAAVLKKERCSLPSAVTGRSSPPHVRSGARAIPILGVNLGKLGFPC